MGRVGRGTVSGGLRGKVVQHRDGRPKKAFNLANLKVYLLKPNNPLKRVMLTTQTPVLRSAAGRLAAVLAAGQERECVKK